MILQWNWKMGNLYKAHYKALILFVLFIVISCSDKDDISSFFPIKEFVNRQQDFSFWQLEQFYGDPQMGYIIRTDDKNVIVIDGGISKSASYIEDYLTQLGGVVNFWIVTHPHQDHIGALIEIVNSEKIKIYSIVHSSLNLDWVKKYEPESYELVLRYMNVLDKSKIPLIEVNNGDNIAIGNGIGLEILGSRNEMIKFNALNNSSLVFKINSSTKSILFLGDLGVEGGNEILRHHPTSNLKADYVQMAHHGQGGVSKEFYETVDATYTLWPTPSWLWENNLEGKGVNSGMWKTLVVRQWMEELNIKKNYVSGLEGTIQID